MPKLPFTKAGMQQKLQELYALDDGQLTVAARAIANDLGDWLDKSFNLSPAQKNYIVQMPAKVRDKMGYDIASVVVVKDPCIPQDPKDYPPGQRTKQTQIKQRGTFTYWPKADGTFEFTSDMAVEIDFILVDI